MNEIEFVPVTEPFLVRRDDADVGYLGFQAQGRGGQVLSKFYLHRAPAVREPAALRWISLSVWLAGAVSIL